jgi:hypothetical protein
VKQARSLAEIKLVSVREKLADLHIETVLDQLVLRCASARAAVACPLIASLQT